MRAQFLNGELFYTLKEAQIMMNVGGATTTRSVRTAVSGASHPSPKRSSLRAEDSHGKWYKNSRLVRGVSSLAIFPEKL